MLGNITFRKKNPDPDTDFATEPASVVHTPHWLLDWRMPELGDDRANLVDVLFEVHRDLLDSAPADNDAVRNRYLAAADVVSNLLDTVGRPRVIHGEVDVREPVRRCLTETMSALIEWDNRDWANTFFGFQLAHGWATHAHQLAWVRRA